MPEIIKMTVYRFEELSDEAKEAAREWYRQGALEYDWHKGVFDDFEAICEILGVQLKRSPVPLFGGALRAKPCISFSGFGYQGDGACFTGQYSYRKGAARKLREYAPRDAELNSVADALQEVQRCHFYQLQADIRHQGRYRHEYSMSISVSSSSAHRAGRDQRALDAVEDALRSLARWLYRALEQEYAFLRSDEVVDEAIIVNDYTFTATGRRLD